MRDIIEKLEQLNVDKEQLDEGHMSDMAHEAEKDHEVQMARSDLYKAAKYAVSIHKMMKDVSEMEGIDGWVASKITKASDYLGSVKHYMEGQMMQDVELAVVPVAGDMTDAMTMPEESVEVAEGRLGFKDIAKFGSEKASRIDQEARRRGSADMEPGDADELRYRIAKEMGLVESQIAEDEEADKKPDMGALLKALKKKLSDEGGAAGFDPLEKIAKDMGVDLTPAMLKGMAGIKMHRDGDYILEDTLEEKDEDVIGDIIASLSKTKERMPMPKSKPKMSMVTKQKAMNKMALPKSRPDMSMAQDTTKPLTMSKFSEWSKK